MWGPHNWIDCRCCYCISFCICYLVIALVCLGAIGDRVGDPLPEKRIFLALKIKPRGGHRQCRAARAITSRSFLTLSTVETENTHAHRQLRASLAWQLHLFTCVYLLFPHRLSDCLSRPSGARDKHVRYTATPRNDRLINGWAVFPSKVHGDGNDIFRRIGLIRERGVIFFTVDKTNFVIIDCRHQTEKFVIIWQDVTFAWNITWKFL